MRTELILLYFDILAEKFLRMLGFIVESERELPGGRSVKITSLLKTEILAKLKDLLKDYKKYKRPANAGEEFKFSTFLALQEYSGEFIELHKTLLWVYTPWVGDETHTFVEDLFRPSLQFYESLNGTLSYIYLYQSYSHHLHEEAKLNSTGTKIIAWGFPCNEKHNPLFWPSILHEIGHEIVSTHNLPQTVCQKWIAFPDYGERMIWAEEILADIIALTLCGPSYLLFFVNYMVFLSRDSLRAPQVAHPPPLSRIEVMKKYLRFTMGIDTDTRETEAFRTYFSLLDERLWFDNKKLMLKRTAPEDVQSETTMYEDAKNKAEEIAHEAISALDATGLPIKRFGAMEVIRSIRFAEKLSHGYMIASLTKQGNELKVRDALKQRRSRNETWSYDKFIDEARKLNETAANSSEIVNAGWFHKAAAPTLLDQCHDKFKGQLLEKFGEAVKAYLALMQESDLLLEKSIEVAFVHSLISEGQGVHE